MAEAAKPRPYKRAGRSNIAVVDDGANLVLFQRMDGAFLGSVDIAQMKARSSAMFPFPTRGLGEIAFGKDGQPGRTPGLAFVPGLAAFPGGLPIKTADGARRRDRGERRYRRSGRGMRPGGAGRGRGPAQVDLLWLTKTGGAPAPPVPSETIPRAVSGPAWRIADRRPSIARSGHARS